MFKTCNFSLCSSNLLLSSLSIFMDDYLEHFWVDYLSPASFSCSFGVLSCSFVLDILYCPSFCLVSPFYYYVSRLVMLPDLGEVAVCRRYVMHPSSTSTGHQSSVLYSIWVVWVILLWRADYCGQSGRHGWPWSKLLLSPALCESCWLLWQELGWQSAGCRPLRCVSGM